MRIRQHLVLTSAMLFVLAPLYAAEPTPGSKLFMSEPGKVLFQDDLSQSLNKEWRAAKGKWEVVAGAIKGSELKSDMHGAVTRHSMPFQNVIIQYSFKLEGAKGTSLSINDSKGHTCRVAINSTGFSVRKDSHDKNDKDPAVTLETQSLPIAPGEWHTMSVEILGKEMLACLDGKEVAFGAHEGIDVAKSNFGLTVAGESVSFKNLRVWEALPSKSWEANKARLLEARSKVSKSSK